MSAGGTVREIGRRTDWLALLPAPGSSEPIVAALGDLATEECETLAAHFGVDGVESGAVEGVVDVVVASASDWADAEHALRSLAPDGVAILFAPRPIRPAALRGAVDSSGAVIRVLSQHAVVPTLENPRRFVPLDRLDAVRWYLRRLYIASGVPARWVRALAARLARPAASAMRARAVVLVGSGWSDRGGPESAAAKALAGSDDVIVTTSGHDRGSRTVLLAFAPGSSSPTRVVKLASTPAVSALTRAEQTVLEDLQTELPPALRSTVPRPLGSFAWHGRAVSTESAFDGATLDHVLREARSDSVQVKWLRRVEDWTIDLAEASAEWIEWDAAAHGEWVEPLVRDAPPSVRSSSGFDRFTVGLESASRRLVGRPLPIVRRHFDLGPWNVVCVDDRIGVIDWEMVGHRGRHGRGLPMCDLDYFAKYWLHSTTGVSGLADELDLFPWLGPTDEAGSRASRRRDARDAVERAASRLGIDTGFLPLLVASNWMEHAIQAAARTEVAGPATTGNKADAYLERLVERLSFDDADER